MSCHIMSCTVPTRSLSGRKEALSTAMEPVPKTMRIVLVCKAQPGTSGVIQTPARTSLPPSNLLYMDSLSCHLWTRNISYELLKRHPLTDQMTILILMSKHHLSERARTIEPLFLYCTCLEFSLSIVNIPFSL